MADDLSNHPNSVFLNLEDLFNQLNTSNEISRDPLEASDVVELIVQFMQLNDTQSYHPVDYQCLRALANFCIYNVNRQKILDSGGINTVLICLQKKKDLETIRGACAVLLNAGLHYDNATSEDVDIIENIVEILESVAIDSDEVQQILVKDKLFGSLLDFLEYSKPPEGCSQRIDKSYGESKAAVLKVIVSTTMSAENKDIIGSCGVIGATSPLLEKDTVQPVQFVVVGIFKHLSSQNVKNSVKIILGENKDDVEKPLTRLLNLIKHTDDLPILSEGTRVLVNLVKNMWVENPHTILDSNPALNILTSTNNEELDDNTTSQSTNHSVVNNEKIPSNSSSVEIQQEQSSISPLLKSLLDMILIERDKYADEIECN
ncbi:1230_t:CDS:10 [Racocetra fulgida]|uniref:1230_t:CDS:1 n=1 Tax=Racocetra fulgida TaxID=60492 RepID=A0A9N8ZYE6_9GLOM|nr:1230_t:CDS:10 [Racocetra fulgida]